MQDVRMLSTLHLYNYDNRGAPFSLLYSPCPSWSAKNITVCKLTGLSLSSPLCWIETNSIIVIKYFIILPFKMPLIFCPALSYFLVINCLWSNIVINNSNIQYSVHISVHNQGVFPGFVRLCVHMHVFGIWLVKPVWSSQTTVWPNCVFVYCCGFYPLAHAS